MRRNIGNNGRISTTKFVFYFCKISENLHARGRKTKNLLTLAFSSNTLHKDNIFNGKQNIEMPQDPLHTFKDKYDEFGRARVLERFCADLTLACRGWVIL